VIADKTFKSIVHALRLSGINILKNALLPSQLPASVSSREEEDMDGIEEEDGHDREEEHAHDSEEDGREQDHWNANGDEANEVHSDSRSPMLDTIYKLREPTACSLLDGTVELALAEVFHLKRLAIQYQCRMGMLWCNLLMCGPMRVNTLYLYQLMGVT
jgi:hypothetical protein